MSIFCSKVLANISLLHWTSFMKFWLKHYSLPTKLIKTFVLNPIHRITMGILLRVLGVLDFPVPQLSTPVRIWLY